MHRNHQHQEDVNKERIVLLQEKLRNWNALEDELLLETLKYYINPCPRVTLLALLNENQESWSKGEDEIPLQESDLGPRDS